jgi:hypothetical protein
MSAVDQLAARLVKVDAEIAEADRQLEEALINGASTSAIREYAAAARRARVETVAAIDSARAEAAAAGQAELDAVAAEIVHAVVERARAELAMLIVPAAP